MSFKVTLITHSCVLVETDHHLLLFDATTSHITLNPDKPLTVLASHAHEDHYSGQIFNLNHPDITYVLSGDITTPRPHITMAPHETRGVNGLDITTLFSTDEGVACLVKADGYLIYFAGDLNDWRWEGEPEKDNFWQKETYRREIDSLPQSVDLAMVVADPRQDGFWLEGLRYFTDHVQALNLLPIHWFGDYSTAQKLKNEFPAPEGTRLLIPVRDNTTFKIQ